MYKKDSVGKVENWLFMIIYIVGGRKKLEERRVRQDKMTGIRECPLNGEAPGESVQVLRTRLKKLPLLAPK